jgi:hypothetical protein
MATDGQLIEICDDELDEVSGGFLDDLYRNGVFSVASRVGGNKLADTMYGRHVTQADRSRAQAAMKRFLVAGGKLPKGVPNLFGR